MGTLEGKVILVTGSSSGIGAACVERFAAEGARVVGADLTESQDKNLAAFAQLDVRDENAIGALVTNTAGEHGRIDGIVTAAGIAGGGPLHMVDASEWQRVMDVNLNGLFYCCREVVPVMREAGYGRIVNIASVAGKDGNPNASAYSASKAAVIALTKSLGKELADSGIRVNCVTPAAVKTAIFEQMSEQHIQFMLSKIPMGRFGTPEEVAAMVGWLCTEDCSFSTGAVFDLSGGRAVY